MHVWLHKVEKFADIIIGPLLILLLFVIVGELFLGEQLEHYSIYVDLFDISLILVFAIDLGFKFNRVRKIPKFLKMYWLQIIAIIPFFLVFRFTGLFGLHELIDKGQSILHEIPEVQKIVKEAGRASRTAKLISMLKFASRVPRFLGAVPFFEKPTGGHHWTKKRKK